MDIFYTSLSKSNVTHDDSATTAAAAVVNGTSKTTTTTTTTTKRTRSSTNGGGLLKNTTSTPFNDDDKVKSSVAFTFESPPHCDSLLRNQSLESHHTEQQSNLQTSNNSSLATSYEYLSRQRKRIILHDQQYVDAQLKIKEEYSKHLKSIDLSKYSFPNETKPKTDYTYAQSGIYISHKTDTLDETPLEPPNLCRRARKVTPSNSILKESSFVGVKESFFGSVLNRINIFSYLYSYLTHKRNTVNVNRNHDQSLSASMQHQNKFYLNDLYGLDEDSNRMTTRSSAQRASSSSSIQQKNVNRDSAAAAAGAASASLSTSTATVVNKSINTSPISDEWRMFSSKTHTEQSKSRRRGAICCSKWCLLLPLLFLLAFLIVPYSRNSETIIEYVNLIHSNSSDTVYNQEYIKNAITQNLNIVRNSFTEALDAVKNNIPDIDKLKSDIAKRLDERLNSTLMLLFSKLNDQESQMKESKSLCDEELKQMKLLIKELQDKYTLLTELSQKHNGSLSNSQNISDIIQYKIEDIIKKTLYVYNADKTGMTDFASESLGANIMFTRCTETYTEKSRWLTILNYPIFQINSSPRIILQNSLHPGNCWAFKGDKGDVFIKLAATIKPKSFSLEHIPKELTPAHSLDTAPRNFSVYGYHNNEQVDADEGFLLGKYEYDNKSNEIIQFFNVQNPYEKPISIVELKIESNGGNKEYTCVYKFRVHGDMIQLDSKKADDSN